MNEFNVTVVKGLKQENCYFPRRIYQRILRMYMCFCFKNMENYYFRFNGTHGHVFVKMDGRYQVVVFVDSRFVGTSIFHIKVLYMIKQLTMNVICKVC